MLKVGLAMLGVAAAWAAAPASADDWRDPEWRQIRVDASALDLSAPAGVDTLAQRIHKAVNRICGSDRYCRDEAWASTEDQVAWAIGRDEWLRRMADERIAQLYACGGYDCEAPQPASYPLPPADFRPMGSGVTVTIIYTAAPASRYEY